MMIRSRHSIMSLISVVFAGMVLLAACVFLVGLFLGWRPVVVRTGSMDPAIPAGSLLWARPSTPDQIDVGDVLVMRGDARRTVTHRVVDVTEADGVRSVWTKGDANASADEAPYVLGASELVGFRVTIGGGRVLALVLHPLVSAGLVFVAVLAAMPLLFRSVVRDIADPA